MLFSQIDFANFFIKSSVIATQYGLEAEYVKVTTAANSRARRPEVSQRLALRGRDKLRA